MRRLHLVLLVSVAATGCDGVWGISALDVDTTMDGAGATGDAQADDTGDGSGDASSGPPSSSGHGTGAPVDGGSGAEEDARSTTPDAGADTGTSLPFTCPTGASAAVICDTFDEDTDGGISGGAPNNWHLPYIMGAGGTLDVDDSQARSGLSLHTVNNSTEGAPNAQVNIFSNLPDSYKTMDIQFDVLLVGALPDPADNDDYVTVAGVDFETSGSGLTGYYSAGIDLDSGGFHLSYIKGGDTMVNTVGDAGAPPESGAWTHVELALSLTTPITGTLTTTDPRGNMSGSGSQNIDGPGATGVPTVMFGETFVPANVGVHDVHIDNVIVRATTE